MAYKKMLYPLLKMGFKISKKVFKRCNVQYFNFVWILKSSGKPTKCLYTVAKNINIYIYIYVAEFYRVYEYVFDRNSWSLSPPLHQLHGAAQQFQKGSLKKWQLIDWGCLFVQSQVQEAQVQLHTANTQGQADPYISLRQESIV